MSENAVCKPGSLRTVWKIFRPNQCGRQAYSPGTEHPLPIRREDTTRPGVSRGVEDERRAKAECNTERQPCSALLASDDSDYIHGATIFGDGGMTLYLGLRPEGKFCRSNPLPMEAHGAVDRKAGQTCRERRVL